MPKNDYDWKSVGAQRLMYHLVEQDRYERLKVNGLLPDHVIATANSKLEKKDDCTKQFADMVDTFRENIRDKRDHPVMQDEIPEPLQQQEYVIETLKEQRETLQKINHDMRQK